MFHNKKNTMHKLILSNSPRLKPQSGTFNIDLMCEFELLEI